MKNLLVLPLLLILTARSFSALANLPDPLIGTNGEKILTAKQWNEKRRAELLELFRENIYGRMPVGRPDTLKFEVLERSANAMDGKATRKQVRISYGGPGGEGAIKLVLFTPNNSSKPAPFSSHLQSQCH